MANTVLVPKGTNKALSREARTEALSSASYLRGKTKNKAPQRAKHEVAITLLLNSSNTKLTPHGGATRLTSPNKVNVPDKVILKSLKKRSFKARGLQLEPSCLVSKQDRVSLANTDLREFLTNK